VSCDGDHCVTCSDEGVPMRVLAATGAGLALCAGVAGGAGGVEVMTDLVGDVRPGDELLVHAGVALARLA
jgi:hydrogenase expression/formation protein HypC